MKKILVFIVALFVVQQAFANHISGGELFYEYVGPAAVSANSNTYKLTMRLFRDCNSSGQALETDHVVIGIYNNNSSNSFVVSAVLKYNVPTTVIKFDPTTIPCLTSAPPVCFQVGLFTGVVDLPSTPDGYILSWVRCCRADDIANLTTPTGIGATFVTTIPGTNKLPTGHNSSPQFAVKDAALVCQNKNFSLDFGAKDSDGDDLTYSFCDAYRGGSVGNANPGSMSGNSQTLSLVPLPYEPPYSGTSPLGAGVTINPTNGQITGIAPSFGRYVINVCVTEKRNGTIINVHRKDFILQIGNCDFAAAEPLPLASTWCKDFSVHFSNNSTSSAIQSYHWDFGVPSSTTDVSDDPAPVFTYPDTGMYTIKLTVKGAAGCSDEATTTIGVFPGFKPDFTFEGSCLQTPFVFKDVSTTAYGAINSWKWNFAEPGATADTSALQNPSYLYSSKGTKNATLVVTSSKGCIASITKPVVVNDLAALTLPFRDTLICAKDTLQIPATGEGTFTWSPAYNIINADSADPSVFPKDSTTYFVSVADSNGCLNKDSVRVNVIKNVTVFAGADASICSTDFFTFQVVSNGLQFHWTPADDLSDANIKNPVVQPGKTTTYTLTASVGNCIANDDITVKVAPLPLSNAGADATICFGESTQLTGSVTGSSYTWSPASTLVSASTLTPVARPVSTTLYTLSVSDTTGCSRVVSDSVLVTVIPHINAFAGNDTTIVANQPLQLTASGGSVYAWSPSTGMNNPSIANPVVTLNASYDEVSYVVRVGVPSGCFVTDTMTVKVFKTAPDIFIPTAFTPNADGRNDLLKPVPVGLSKFDYFKVFNRWGQLVYSTSQTGTGWDGTMDGKEQPSGTYVFVAQGTTYLGSPLIKKGTVILIR